MVRLETPSISAAWSSETLRPIRGSCAGADIGSDVFSRIAVASGVCRSLWQCERHLLWTAARECSRTLNSLWYCDLLQDLHRPGDIEGPRGLAKFLAKHACRTAGTW